MKLKELAEACTSTTGLVHTQNIRALRLYMKQTDTETLQKEVKELDDAASLRALWEAGVAGWLQDAYFERMNEVMR